MRFSVALALVSMETFLLCGWLSAEPGNDVAYGSSIPPRCPRGCACIGTTVDCSHRGLTQVPKYIPLDTERL